MESVAIRDSQFRAIICDNDLWLSQREISKILASNTRSVNDIIRDLERSGHGSAARVFSITKQEGGREIRRNIKHYCFEIIYTIAIRSNRLDKLTGLAEFAHKHNLLKPHYCIPVRKELFFRETLTALLGDITPIQYQFPMAGFFVDFYLPELRLVVEFDEEHHKKYENIAKDRRRQHAIETAFGVTFLRVAQGQEMLGLNQIVKILLASREANHSV